jgi:hypothetical protein
MKLDISVRGIASFRGYIIVFDTVVPPWASCWRHHDCTRPFSVIDIIIWKLGHILRDPRHLDPTMTLYWLLHHIGALHQSLPLVRGHNSRISG